MDNVAQWIGESLRNQPLIVVLLVILAISVVWIAVAYFWNFYWVKTKRVDLGGKKHAKK